MSNIFRGLSRVVTSKSLAECRKVNLESSYFAFAASHFSSNVKPTPASKEEIDKLVQGKKLVVFMKGVPDEPRCGFSNAVVQVLRMYGITNYDSYNVLQDESIRQGIKAYSNWPTIPQIYIDGQFIGGCDIFLEMHKSGELEQHFEKAGISATPPPSHKE